MNNSFNNAITNKIHNISNVGPNENNTETNDVGERASRNST